MIKSYQNLEPETKCFSGKDLENRAHHFDLYILNDFKSKSEGLRVLKKMNPQKQNFVIIPQLRASKVQLDFFKSLPKERNGFVMLEFYRFALLIDRKESSGEYFKIRKWGAF